MAPRGGARLGAGRPRKPKFEVPPGVESPLLVLKAMMLHPDTPPSVRARISLALAEREDAAERQEYNRRALDF